MKQKHYLFEILISGLLLAVAAVVRYYYITNFITAPYGDTGFLEMSMIRQGMEVPYLSNLLSALYAGGLRLIFWLAGNKEMAVVYVQAVIQLVTLLLFYLAYRKLFGGLFAVLLLLAAMFWEPGLWLVGEVTPGNLLLLLMGAYCFLFACALRRGEQKKSRVFFVFGFLGSGIAVGLLAATDSYGLLLLLWSILVIVFMKKLPIGFLAGASAGFAGAGLAKCVYYGFSLEVPYLEYYRNYLSAENWNPVFRFGKSSMALNFLMILFVLGCIWFLCTGKKRAVRETSEKVSAIPEISVKNIEDLPVPKLMTIPCVQETDEKEEEEAKREIKYIENPLPVPKKHVKKEMTYAFEPDAAHMCYDLETSSDSDYDIE
ncbi:MAG: hypothetical protein J6B10_03525 [Lachnospiraceae bacterium]|nr:hypothetical protein [Lachnospiraceae bacterium]